MTTPLRIGLIGCGAIAQIMHIPYLVEYAEKFDLVALSDYDAAVLAAVADRFHIQRRYTDWRELMAQSDIDAVVICHSGSHRDSVLAALDADKHIFAEKPLAWNVRETEEIAARAAQSDRILQMAYHKRYDPGYFYAREAVQQMKDIGFARITVLHPANELGFSPHRIRRGNGIITEGHIDPGTWESQVQGQRLGLAEGDLAAAVDEALGTRKADPRLRLAYGILTVSLIHQVYMLYGFLGEPTRVINTDIWRDGLSIHTVVEYPNQLHCTLDWHFLSHLKDYSEEYAFYGNFDRVHLQFPSPYFRNFPSPVIIQGGEKELSWEKRVIVSHQEAFLNELLAFYECVTNGTSPATSVQDAVMHSRFIQQVIDAAH